MRLPLRSCWPASGRCSIIDAIFKLTPLAVAVGVIRGWSRPVVRPWWYGSGAGGHRLAELNCFASDSLPHFLHKPTATPFRRQQCPNAANSHTYVNRSMYRRLFAAHLLLGVLVDPWAALSAGRC